MRASLIAHLEDLNEAAKPIVEPLYIYRSGVNADAPRANLM
ncbi:hypothetical protein [Paraburkholderia denitrificans]